MHRDVYSDPEIFELEMKYIFERTWNFLTIESQIPKPNDYITTYIGRTPVVVSRDAKGNICAFLNTCRHKGATVCRFEKGNSKYHVCLYHGWAYDSAARTSASSSARSRIIRRLSMPRTTISSRWRSSRPIRG